MEITGSYTFDVFSTFFSPWHEAILAASRSTPYGTIIARTYEGIRTTSGTQFELELFPKIRKGTYADVAVAFAPSAFAPSAALYPQYRLQLDVYQNLWFGFEGSLGYRHLQFSSGVDMGVVTVSKYLGDFLLSLRSFVVPDLAGSSVSLYAVVRRYFPDGVSYLGARFGHGNAKDEIYSAVDAALVDSNTVGVEASFFLFDRLDVGARTSLSAQARTADPAIWQFENTVTCGVRF